MNALRASILLYRYGPFYIANRFFLMLVTDQIISDSLSKPSVSLPTLWEA